jgi:hypothetical protein
MPRLAGEGLRICWYHHGVALRNLNRLVELDDDLTLALKRYSSPQAPRPEGGRSSGMPAAIDSDVTAVRDILRMQLSNMVAVVAIERRFMHPSNDVESYVAFLRGPKDSTAEWLSNHPRYASSWGAKMTELAGMASHTAYRSRPDTMRLGPCPLTISENGQSVPCPGDIRFDTVAYAEDVNYQPSCTHCLTKDTVKGWELKLIGSIQEPQLPAPQLAAWLSTQLSIPITASMVRNWASDGHISLVDRNQRNQPLYDRDTAETFARQRNGLPERAAS